MSDALDYGVDLLVCEECHTYHYVDDVSYEVTKEYTETKKRWLLPDKEVNGTFTITNLKPCPYCGHQLYIKVVGYAAIPPEEADDE